MKKYVLALLVILLGPAQLNAQDEEKTNVDIFMSHLQYNWDDIHDVIMRFHYVDPWLKGKVLIDMQWVDGKLESGEILENTSGNDQYAIDLLKALQQWEISELADEWSSVLPIQTTIKGSDDPDFSEYGILTGKLTDKDGVPISEEGLVLTSSDRTSQKSIALHTNREGIFIETLIPPGTYRISCNIKGYDPGTIKNIVIEKGQHCMRDVQIK